MEMTHQKKHVARIGGWLPRDAKHVDRWIRWLKERVAERPRPLAEPIEELQQMVYSDPVLHANVAMMFAGAHARRKQTPLGEPEVKSFEEFLVLLDAIMTMAPEAYQTVDSEGARPELAPAGLIGFPINALLDWPMATAAGYSVFSNSLVNQQLKKILGHWSRFLMTPESRYVLVEGDPRRDHLAIPWLGERAQEEMVAVACAAVGGPPCTGHETFASIFDCTPTAAYYGFRSWDDFFTRTFVDGMRPVADPHDDDVIVNACESAPFALRRDVALSAKFWLKGQPYSLESMLDWDELAPRFDRGTVYQAFLSALSYHRWHSPVSGTIAKIKIVNGSYYLQSESEGFQGPDGADPSAPNDSQAFLTAVATRALIFIKADNPKIGLMCVMLVGMAEVSSNEVTVKVGDHVDKGQQLGMFHFGGSTHCLIFRPEVKLQFTLHGQEPGPHADTNIRVNAKIAAVR